MTALGVEGLRLLVVDKLVPAEADFHPVEALGEGLSRVRYRASVGGAKHVAGLRYLGDGLLVFVAAVVYVFGVPPEGLAPLFRRCGRLLWFGVLAFQPAHPALYACHLCPFVALLARTRRLSDVP